MARGKRKIGRLTRQNLQLEEQTRPVLPPRWESPPPRQGLDVGAFGEEASRAECWGGQRGVLGRDLLIAHFSVQPHFETTLLRTEERPGNAAKQRPRGVVPSQDGFGSVLDCEDRARLLNESGKGNFQSAWAFDARSCQQVPVVAKRRGPTRLEGTQVHAKLDPVAMPVRQPTSNCPRAKHVAAKPPRSVTSPRLSL